ncbi:MAG: hypothetical protein V4510_10655 [bacterium]
MGRGTGGAVLAVARHEVRQLASAFENRATRYGLVAAVVVLALAWPAVQQHGLHPDAGLYPIEIRPGAELGPAAMSDGRFRLAAAGERPLLILSGTSFDFDRDDPASRAAAQELHDAALRWQESRLDQESDQAAAFPVAVNLAYQPRDLTAPSPPAATGPVQATTPSLPASLVNETRGTAHQQTGLRPGDIQPPFPVRSLLLTFAYLIPMNFLAQLFAGSLLSERVRHRGLLVLTAPMSPGAVLVGRSLPYVVAAAIVYVASSLAIGATGIGWLAALPIVAFVLVAALVLGNVARSPRELTFLLTGTTTLFSTFLFLPAVFTALPPVAYLSPVTVIAASIQNEPVAWAAFLYATLPLALAATALAFVGFGLYNEQTLFSQMHLGAKLRAAVGRWTATRRGLLLAGALAVPFALALELFVLALFIPLGLKAAFPAFIMGAAFLEESLKLLATSSQRRRPGWQAGLLVGAGFFVGEKLALLVGLAGFGGLDLGGPTLRLLGAQGGLTLLVAPLLLHAAAAALAGLGVGKGRGWPALAWLSACVLHTAYNVTVLAAGGGL